MSSRTLLSVSVLSQARGKAVPTSNHPFLSCSYGNGCCIHSWLFPHKYIIVWSPPFQHLMSPPAETGHRAWFKCSVFCNSCEGTTQGGWRNPFPFSQRNILHRSSALHSKQAPLWCHFSQRLTRVSWNMSCSVLQPSTDNPKAAQDGSRTPGSCRNVPRIQSIRKFDESWLSLLLTFFYQEWTGKVLHPLWEVFLINCCPPICKNENSKDQSPSNSHNIECQDDLTVKSYKQSS